MIRTARLAPFVLSFALIALVIAARTLGCVMTMGESDVISLFHFKPASAVVSDSAGIPFRAGAGGVVTALVSARAADGGRLTAVLSGAGSPVVVAASHGMRHRAVDLTPYLGRAGEFRLDLRAESGGPVAIDEVLIRQTTCPPVSRSGRIFIVAMLALAVAFVFRGRPVLVASVVVGALAFAVRWESLSGWVGQPLLGDAVFYRELGTSLSWSRPFDTGMREPVQVWLNAFLAQAGGGPYAVRLLSSLLSSIAAALIVPAGARLFGSVFAGVAAGALFAVGDFQSWNALRGERSETYAFLALVYIVALIAYREKKSFLVDAALGLLAVALSLTWLIGALGATLAYVARLKIMDRRIARSAVFGALLLSGLLPHFLAQQRLNGDPLFALNAHTGFYRGVETAGVPSYGHGHGSLGRFLFERPVGRSADLAGGYVSMFLDPRSPFNRIFLGFHYSDGRSAFLYPFLIAGLLAAVWRRRWLAFWLTFSFVNVSPAMAGAVRDPRLFLFAGLFVALYFGAGVGAAARGAGVAWARFTGGSRKGKTDA